MFFRKKKDKQLLAVASGTIIEIGKVKDPVFSEKMMGDGFAIETTSNTAYAPANGKLTLIFPTLHAYGITTDDGCEILVHIGLDTVNEKGNGFQCSLQLNDEVKAGDAIVTFDRQYLESKGYDLTTMIIFPNPSTYKGFNVEYGKFVEGGKDIVATYK